MTVYDKFSTELSIDDCVVYVSINDEKHELSVGGIVAIIDEDNIVVEGFDGKTHNFPSEDVIQHCTELH